MHSFAGQIDSEMRYIWTLFIPITAAIFLLVHFKALFPELESHTADSLLELFSCGVYVYFKYKEYINVYWRA